jgi:hypothetical protein
MNALKIVFDWIKDSKGDVVSDGKWGGRLVPTEPLRNDMAILAFSNVKSKHGLLDFVHHYGLLNGQTTTKRSEQALLIRKL